MPIEVQHQPPMNIVGAGAYKAGAMEGTAKRREELWDRQMDLARLQQADRAQRLNLIGQQQSQAFAAQQANQRMMMENYLNQQNNAVRFDQEQQLLGQRNRQAMDLYGMQNRAVMERAAKEHEYSILDSAYKSRASIEQMLGDAQTSPGGLSEVGQGVYDKIQASLAELDANVEKGRPADYYYALNELQGMATQLRMPRMRNPEPNPEAEISAQTFDRADGTRWMRGKDGWEPSGYHTVNGIPAGKRFFDPSTGSIGWYDPKTGKLNTEFNGPEKYMELMQDVMKEMDSEVKNAKSSTSAADLLNSQGDVAAQASSSRTPLPPWATNNELREAELQNRLSTRWKLVQDQARTAYNLGDQPAGPAPGGPPAPQQAPQPQPPTPGGMPPGYTDNVERIGSPSQQSSRDQFQTMIGAAKVRDPLHSAVYDKALAILSGPTLPADDDVEAWGILATALNASQAGGLTSPQ